MLLGGDEFGRTQGGNNNAWCQDTEISWFDWELRRGSEDAARVHAAADRAAPRAPGVPPAPVPARARDRGLRPARRAGGSGPTARRMTRATTGTTPARTCSAMFLNGEEIAAPGPRGRRVVDDSFLLLFNAHHEDRDVHAARAGASATQLDARASTRRDPTSSRRRAGRARAATVELVHALARRCCAAPTDWRRCARPTGCSSAAELRRSRRRASSCPYLRDLGVSHLYLPPSFQARAGSTHGYDVVDPTRDLGRARRRGRVPRAGGGGARGRPGDRARHRPEPHGDRRRQPATGPTRSCARSSSTSTRRPAGTGASSTSTTSPGVRQEDPEVFAATHGLALRARARGARRRAADRPSRRARRPGRLPRAAARRAASSTSGWRRSSTPASSCATGRSRARSATSSSTTSPALFVDPAGEAPLTALWEELSRRRRGRSASWALEAKLEQARDDVRARGRAAARALARRRRGWSEALASLPVYRTYVRGRGRRREDLRACCAEAGRSRDVARGSAPPARSSRASSRRRRR